MSNDRIRASISATLAEIVPTSRALGLPADYADYEAWEIIARIEAKLQASKGKPKAGEAA